MPRDSNGNYSLPSGTLVSSGDTVLPSQHNPAMNDIATSMSNSLSRDGQGAMRANLNMGGFNLINLNGLTVNGDVTIANNGRIYFPLGSMYLYSSATGIGFFDNANSRVPLYYSNSENAIHIDSPLKVGVVTASSSVTVNGSPVWTQAGLTNLSQLTNGPGYISSITSSMVTTALGFTPARTTGQVFSGDVVRSGNNGGSSFGLGLLGGNAMYELNGTNTGIYYDNSAGRIKLRIGGNDVASIDGSGNLRVLGNVLAGQSSV